MLTDEFTTILTDVRNLLAGREEIKATDPMVGVPPLIEEYRAKAMVE